MAETAIAKRAVAFVIGKGAQIARLDTPKKS